MKTHTNIVIKY